MSPARRRGSGSGGLKGGLWTIVFLVVLIGAGLAWAKSNNIHSVTDAYNYVKAWSNKADQCTQRGINKQAPCRPKVPNGSTGNGGSTGDRNGGSGSTGGNGNGKGGNGSNTIDPASHNGSTSAYDAKLDLIATANADTKAAYKRSEWKHWIGSPCNTRETVLKTQGKNVVIDPSTCSIKSGTWTSPYDLKTTTNPLDLDIDHVIPLGYAAQHGGQPWSVDKKQQYANDTTQLLAVSLGENRKKGDLGPSGYMPAHNQCMYAKIWVDTASKYGLSLASADKNALKSALATC